MAFQRTVTVAIMNVILQLVSAAAQKSVFGKTLDVDLPLRKDLRVRDLDKIYPAYASFEGQMFAGSLPIDHEQADGTTPRTGNLQFWLFVPDSPTAPNTMVSWFNGGPGCSSLATGVMFEHGPVTVPLHPAGWCCEDSNEPLQPNPYAWTNSTVMLYVEQPVGVGFSEATNGTPPPASEDDVAADFESFLQNFYSIFGDLTSHSLYLVGESYAGIYIPSIARGIYLRNREQENDPDNGNDRIHISLGGVAIGNGKIDAITQDPAVIDFTYFHGLIDGPTREFLHADWDSCMTKVDLEDGEIGRTSLKTPKKSTKGEKAEEVSPFHPFTVRDDCGVLGAVLEAAGADAFEPLPGGPNLYEYSTWDPYAAGEVDTGTVGSFYNDINVQKALNVPVHRQGMHWQGCIPELTDADERRRLTSRTSPSGGTNGVEHPHRKLFMDNDTPWTVVPYLAQLLDEANIDVLIYSGDRDIICCTQGTEEALRKMDWSGTQEPAPGYNVATSHQNAWTHATRSLWLYNNSYPAGYIKSYKNLKLLTVYNAGHMVPYNQPGPGLDMMERYLRGESFHDRPLVSYLSHVDGNEMKKQKKETSFKISVADATDEVMPSSVAREDVPISAMLMLTVSVAFIVGFFVARFTAGITTIRGHQRELPNLGMDGYGSISTQL